MAEYDDDAHPRDEKGRFTSGGGGSAVERWAKDNKGGRAGGASDKDGAQAWAGAQKGVPHERDIKREWVGKQHEDKSWSGQLVGNKPETWQEHFTAHPDKGGKPTEERAAMHDREFIKPAFEGKKTAAELGERPTAILTMGGPASGKGTVLKEVMKDRDMKHVVHIDPDEVKANIPEYKASVPQPEHINEKGKYVAGSNGLKGDGTGPTFRGAANQVHEESSYVAKQIQNQAIEKGHHVIIDGTGGNADKFIDLMSKLKDKGYDVHVHYPHLDSETGIERAAGRAERSGRFVPHEVIRDTYNKIGAARDRIMAAAPKLTVYDAANKHAVAYEKHEGGEKVHNPALMKSLR